MSNEIPPIFQQIFTLIDKNKDKTVTEKELKSLNQDEISIYIKLVQQIPAQLSTELQRSVWANEKNEVQDNSEKKYDKKITEIINQYGEEGLFKASDVNNDGKITKEDEFEMIYAKNNKEGRPNFKSYDFQQELNLLTEEQQVKFKTYLQDKFKAGEEISKESFFAALKEIKGK